jgi:hypothetical protein
MCEKKKIGGFRSVLFFGSFFCTSKEPNKNVKTASANSIHLTSLKKE